MKHEITEWRRLLTEAQTAEFLGVSRSKLRQQRHAGPKEGHFPFVPYVKVGRNIRYDLEDLEKLVKENRVTWNSYEAGTMPAKAATEQRDRPTIR